jgi:tartrate dehydrogenase/decarboxylase/D-malate dehydrogenase
MPGQDREPKYRIAVIPGDGVGKELSPVGVLVLEAIAKCCGFDLDLRFFPWGCEYYLQTGAIMPSDGLEILREFDAIYLGTLGDPRVDDTIHGPQFLFKIRKQFEQYVNLRPVRLLPGVKSPLRDKGPDEIDFLIVRENTEGEITGIGGTLHADQPGELAVSTTVFTRTGTERVGRYAFELARTRRRNLINITKSNSLGISMGLWDRVLAKMAAEYPDVNYQIMYADAAAQAFVRAPERFDVAVTSNLIGDILSDLGGALVGGIAMCAGGNINPEQAFPSMFEPLHGSAPHLAGKDIANPIGLVLAAVMLLNHLGEFEAASLIEDSVVKVLEAGICTKDIGGEYCTTEVGNAIVHEISSHSR